MKFVARHRSDVLNLLEKRGIAQSEIEFIKRRGRICICHPGSGMRFCYLRKEETRLDPFTRQWTHVQWFKVKLNDSREQQVDNWELVMEKFDQWTLLVSNR